MLIRPPQQKSEMVFFTPEMAVDVLEKMNSDNRNISQQWAEELANDMRMGRWRATSDSIGFDRNKILVDGQHRMWAIVLSGIGQWFSVVYDCDERNGEVRDRKRRDAIAIFQSRHIKVSVATVAAVKSLGKFLQKSTKRISDGDVVALQGKIGDKIDVCQRFTKSLCDGSGVSYNASFAVGYFILGHYMNQSKLDNLMSQILGGLDLSYKTKIRKYHTGLAKGGRTQNKVLPESFLKDMFDIAIPGEFPGVDPIIKFIKEKYNV